jgi:3-deoxy-7-phosphoheptulonate synthase
MNRTKRNGSLLASREVQPDGHVIHLPGGVELGGLDVVVMAGPCAVEDLGQLQRTAEVVRANGVRVLRGGAFKPRTSPYSFQGLGRHGLELLRVVADRLGMAVVTEVVAPEDMSLVAEYADMLQIGARNMANYRLLEAAGRSGRPVLLKRGLGATIDELLLAAEYVLAEGNPNVALCERGIRTFETATRFTLDINAIPLLKERSPLPVVLDPSHGTGDAGLVGPAARAGIAAGADALLIEVHPNPSEALCDGSQSLDPSAFARLAGEVGRVAAAVDRGVG